MHPLLCERCAGGELEGYRPAAGGVGLDEPVRLNGDGLMDELEAAFGLADGFDGIGPQAGGPIECQADVDAEPFIDEVQRLGVVQIQLPAELAEAIAAA